jgi:hypothetical protein
MAATRKPLSCATCGEPARWYYLGARCPIHAPAEEQVRQAAIARARRRDLERATPNRPDRETR